MAPRAIEIDGGEPVGPVTVAPVRLEFTLASWKPNGEPSWPTVTVVPIAADGQAAEPVGALIGLLALRITA